MFSLEFSEKQKENGNFYFCSYVVSKKNTIQLLQRIIQWTCLFTQDKKKKPYKVTKARVLAGRTKRKVLPMSVVKINSGVWKVLS